jgi:REP element-mobilizing transposase RayT
MIISERQNQIKKWISSRKTPFNPFVNLDFLQKPNDFNLDKEMEFDSEKIILREEYCPPGIRTLQRTDIEWVGRFRSNLPHWKLSGSTYFITFCVKERAIKPFCNSVNANIVEQAIYHYHGKQCNIDNYVIMPDHVHLLMTPHPSFDFRNILENLKRYTARMINKDSQIHGSFWQTESFDHLVRNMGYWVRYFDYIHNNPAKAGLVKNPNEYIYSSLNKWYS